MQNVSSQWTLFLKMVLPIFWIAFFGTITSYVFFSRDGNIGGGIPPEVTKVVFLVVLFGGLLLMYFLFMRLKRVEMDPEFLYVTNYIKVYRYPFSNIEKVTERRGLIFRVVTVTFVEPGNFGKQVNFLAGSYFREYLGKHPHIAEAFARK